MTHSIVSVCHTPAGVEVTCDCATVTVLELVADGPITGAVELAFTCDGCGSAHWFTLEVGREHLDSR